MAGFISKQPNGLYCRFSTVVDCPTDWNMTEEDYVELCKQKAEKEARDVLANHLYPFEAEDYATRHITTCSDVLYEVGRKIREDGYATQRCIKWLKEDN